MFVFMYVYLFAHVVLGIHQILMDKQYYLGVNLEFWDVIVDSYQGLTSTVKWNGDTSPSFSINQGVRQGVFSQLICTNNA